MTAEFPVYYFANEWKADTNASIFPALCLYDVQDVILYNFWFKCRAYYHWQHDEASLDAALIYNWLIKEFAREHWLVYGTYDPDSINIFFIKFSIMLWPIGDFAFLIALDFSRDALVYAKNIPSFAKKKNLRPKPY